MASCSSLRGTVPQRDESGLTSFCWSLAVFPIGKEAIYCDTLNFSEWCFCLSFPKLSSNSCLSLLVTVWRKASVTIKPTAWYCYWNMRYCVVLLSSAKLKHETYFPSHSCIDLYILYIHIVLSVYIMPFTHPQHPLTDVCERVHTRRRHHNISSSRK